MISRTTLVSSLALFSCCITARVGAEQNATPEPSRDLCPPPCVAGDESIMAHKQHGSSSPPVEKELRWGIDSFVADGICNFNRDKAEKKWFYVNNTSFLKDTADESPIHFYSVDSGKLVFTAPVGRTKEDFLKDTDEHGWPSFRDGEVNWDNVRVIPSRQGETVTLDGTHLGHNNPDDRGNRYCINLICIAGHPKGTDPEEVDKTQKEATTTAADETKTEAPEKSSGDDDDQDEKIGDEDEDQDEQLDDDSDDDDDYDDDSYDDDDDDDDEDDEEDDEEEDDEEE